MKLNNKRTILVGLAFLSICAFWQMYDSIVPLILTKTFHMNETFSGAIMAADNILALFLLPFFGSVSDKSHSKLGKRMPFILFGTGCAIILMNILPLLDNSYAAQPSGFKTASFVIVLGLLLVAMGTYRAPAVALMPDVTPKPLRSRANAIINLMGAVGGILYLGVAAVLYPNSKTAGLDHVNYQPLFIVVSAIMFVAVAVLFLTIREPKLTAENQALEKQHPEWNLAQDDGSGHAIERRSATVPQAFFYSATYFPSHRYIVRSALPYNDNLASVLNTDKNYLWFALGAVVLLTLLLYNFTRRLGNNITKLRLFASRADHNESLDIKDLAVFPDDELGDIAERIIKVYKRYQRTRREQDELKRQLTHNIAHELKTPVASIQGYLETLINHPTIDEKTRQMFFDRCYAQSQRLSSLLADISTLNVMDEVKDLHGKETVDLARMVREIEQETALQFQQRQMRLLVSLPAELTVRGVRSMLYSIFRNLIDNALAYAGEETTVYVKARAEDSYWQFTTADTGRGVPEEHLPRLFERFYRVDKGRSRSLGGTGLGLAIVKNAVILHRGSIRVSNREGGGLQFDFSLAKE